MFPKHFGRTFELWAYLVGHGQLLLRSTKTEEHSTRVDVAFKDVTYLQLPTLMDRLSILTGTATDFPGDVARTMDMSHKNVYILQSEAIRGVVIAGYGEWREDDGEYSEPSVIFPQGYAQLPVYTR